jgi:PAS domain S-box-containing protein
MVAAGAGMAVSVLSLPCLLAGGGAALSVLGLVLVVVVFRRSGEADSTGVKFQSLLQASPDAILITGRQGQITLINAQAEKLFGYTPEEIRGRPVEGLFIKASRPERTLSCLMQYSASMTEQVGSSSDLVGRHKDGSEFYVDLRSSPLQTREGLLIIHVIRNVTERKTRERQRMVRHAAQRILAESSTLREAAPDLLQALCQGLNWDLAILWTVDRQTGELHRVGVGHATSCTPFGPECPIRERTLPARSGWPGRVLFAGQPLWVADRKEGTEESLLLDAKTGLQAAVGFPIVIGGEVLGVFELFARQPRPRDEGVLETLQSVGDKISQFLTRKQAEEAVYQSEARKAAILEAALDAIITFDHAGRIVEFNPAAEQMFGRPRAEALGGEMADLLPAAEAAEFRRRLAQGDEPDGVPGYKGRRELTARRADGSAFPIELTTTRIRTDDALLFSCYVRDLTERKQAEARLQQTEERYRQAQKMEAVGRLAGGIAHDFNNILTAITGFADLLLLTLKGDDLQKEYVQHILTSSERAAALVRQMLTFSRKHVQALKVLDLNSLVSNMNKMLHRVIGEDMSLSAALATDLSRVKADPGQLEQVLMNLVVNARDAMPQGGKLTLETANVELDESYTRAYPGVRPGAYVMLAVTDSGCGMSKEVQARLFEPFFTTKEVGKGTGLGLATVYGIVKQSEGHIAVYSEVGRGTTFKVYLPAVREAVTVPPVVAAIPGPVARMAGTGTVLLVEDEDHVRQLSRQILQVSGYRVLEARHAAEALALYEQQDAPVDLMVTDVVMPEMNGCDLASRLQERRPDLRVLFMSGYTDNAVLRHGLLSEGAAFLQKPFTAAALANKVQELLCA